MTIKNKNKHVSSVLLFINFAVTQKRKCQYFHLLICFLEVPESALLLKIKLQELEISFSIYIKLSSKSLINKDTAEQVATLGCTGLKQRGMIPK